MNRRSFVMSMFGGVAAAGLGGMSLANAASAKADLTAAMQGAGALDATTSAALDQADAGFTQAIVRERVIVRRPRRRRPVVVRRTIVRRPRRVVVRRRVIVR